MTEGYIFLKPLGEMNVVTWANGFVKRGKNYGKMLRYLNRGGGLRLLRKSGELPAGRITPEVIDAYWANELKKWAETLLYEPGEGKWE